MSTHNPRATTTDTNTQQPNLPTHTGPLHEALLDLKAVITGEPAQPALPSDGGAVPAQPVTPTDTMQEPNTQGHRHGR